MAGKRVTTFKELLKYGKVFEKEKKIDERQQQLSGKKSEKVSELKEKYEKEEQRNKKDKSEKKVRNYEKEEVADVAIILPQQPRGSQNPQGQQTTVQAQGGKQGWTPRQGSWQSKPQTNQPSAQQANQGRKTWPCRKCNATNHKTVECPQITCYVCQETGHVATNCPHRAQSLFCYKCKHPGVLFRDCPKCNPQTKQAGN